MGGFVSKFFYFREDDEVLRKADETDLSTPIKYSITPPMRRKFLSVDPRSASSGIPRTPLEVTPTPTKNKHYTVSAIPQRLQARQYLETNFDETLPTSVVKASFDPRSPNVPQPRTPIVVPVCSKIDITVAAKNENLGLVCQDPRSPSIDFDRTPILKPKSPQNTHKLLDLTTDPNLTFCEVTSTDNVLEIQALPDIVQNLEDILKTTDTCDNELKKEIDDDCEKEESDPHPSPVVAPEKTQSSTQKLIDNLLITALKRIETDEKIQIWQDSEPIPDNENVHGDEVDGSTNLKECKDEVIIDVDELHKIETQKIKENKSKSVHEEKKKNCLDSLPLNRTPLGNRSNNNAQVKIKSKNSSQSIVRNKAMFKQSQQENTPPGKKGLKLNSTQWDSDTTILI